ncbi:DNA polymerase domain-containing protein, partial [Lacticaseibacillus paracasei]
FDGRTELKGMMKAAKKAGNDDDATYYDMKQTAYKLFGNSLYGLLGNPYFQLYDIDNSASITAFGKELIQTTTKDLVYYFDNELKDDRRY